MRILSINSGSNGNAIYVESARTGAGVLLDCGISRLRIEKALQLHGRYISHIRAVFITHEHLDHVRGLEVLSRRTHAPVFMTGPTWHKMWNHRSVLGQRLIANTDEIAVEDIKVTARPKSHDAADPVFFKVECDGQSFVYATDLGVPGEDLHTDLASADAALLEFNYDRQMLLTGSYPVELKHRVDSNWGHLSNAQAVDVLRTACDGSLRLLMPGHISEENNTHDIVMAEVKKLCHEKKSFGPDVVIASRYQVGEMVELNA
jgi:phosphoribosyl 1,2-cyclic phosphodiesterase